MPPTVAVVAAVQAAPVYLNLEKSLTRALELIAEAAKRRAQLVVFPEAWLPGYPAWLDTCRDVAVWDHQPVKKLYSQLMAQSVTVPGRATEVLGEAARKHNLTLVMGVHERVMSGAGRGTLYNSILTFGPSGELLNVHRKLVPTFNERLIWGAGDGQGLRVVETPVGRIGGLICWEHWMPMARQRLHMEGEDIHLALWPSVKEMYQIASRHYAFEGRCFVVSAGSIMRRSDLPAELEAAVDLGPESDEFILNGGSSVIGPDGMYVAGPSFGSEVIILARINLDRIREESLTLDVTGHFNRPDLFDFQFNAGRKDRGPLEAAAQEAKAEQNQKLLIGSNEESEAEMLAQSGTDGAHAFRIISSPGPAAAAAPSSANFDAEIHEIGMNR